MGRLQREQNRVDSYFHQSSEKEKLFEEMVNNP